METDLFEPGWEPAFLRRVRRRGRRLRGLSRDRLDALGESFFEEVVRHRLRGPVVDAIQTARETGCRVVLRSSGLDHVVRPIAHHVGADRIVARRLEFRSGLATGVALPDPTEQPLRALPRPRAILLDGGRTASPPFSVRESLAGRHVLLVGVSGFIGKVWLAQLLEDVPGVGRVSVLVRRRGVRSARERFVRVLERSPVFRARPLRADRVEVLEGDVTLPRLGLPRAPYEDLLRSVDLVVNSAGLTEFNPDLREALAVNVDGVERLLELVRASDRAALLHVSTCFVAGKREGRIPERLTPYETPAGTLGFDPRDERRMLARIVDEVTTPGRAHGSARRALRAAGVSRARELGWPNIYTYTKALGEGFIATHRPDVSVAVVRPSIVESSLAFPFPGWNEGINTSAPLSHLLGTHFRHLPVNERKRLDVIPVDLVTRGLTLVGAALVSRRHEAVYQLATSAWNPLDLRRAVELTALAHGKHYRRKRGWRSALLARLEAVPVSRERYGRLSVPAQLRFLRGLDRALGSVLQGRSLLARPLRTLQRVKELIDLYEPFLLDNEPVFENDHVELLREALVEQERGRFDYDVPSIDWYDYWVHVHIPALRQWSYPILEGRPVSAEPHPVPAPARTANAAAAGAPVES